MASPHFASAFSPFTLSMDAGYLEKAKGTDSFDGNPPRTVDPGATSQPVQPPGQGLAQQPQQSPSQLPASQAPVSGSMSTDNTRQVQNTGLGPSTLNPAADSRQTDPTNSPSPFIEIGSAGLAQYGGFVRDEFLPQLQGDRGLRVFREMYDNDPIVGALVFAIQMLMRKVEWRVEPPESPTVAGIVASRQKERLQMVAQRRQAQQAQLMQSQAGLAGAGGSGASGMAPGKPGAVPGKPQPTPSAAAPLSDSKPPPAFHEPLNGVTSPTPTVRPVASTGANTPTPPSAPGANAQPNGATAPGTNFPAAPNSPSSNPTGGPNQGGALHGADGLPGSRPTGMPGAVDPGNDSEIGGLQKRPPVGPISKALLERMEKAGSSGGQFIGGIDAEDVGAVPIDPETGEPMDFPIGTSPMDPVSPEEQHAMELAVLVETCLHDLSDSWSDTISQIATMIVYGFAFHEIVYKKRNGPNPEDPTQGSRYADGAIGWAKIAGRAQETRHRWEFDDNGNCVGMWQLAPPKFQLKYIPLSKALLFRTTGYKQNPEGRSILRSAYRPWYLKRRIEEIEAIGIERNLAGIPVVYVPYQWMSPTATPDEQMALNEVKRIVRNVRNDEQAGLVFPSILDPETKAELFKFELVSTAGGSSSKVTDTDKVISRYDNRIAMVALVDFILLGHETAGSKALAETKADLFTTALESWLNVIADVFNNFAIPRLMQMNGEDPAMSPRLAFGKLSTVSLTELGSLLTALAGAGADIFPDPIMEDFIRNMAGLPPKAATDDL